MPDFEVVWDGRGLLNREDWPPQRHVPDYTFEPSEKPVKGRGTYLIVCAGCNQRFMVSSRRGREGQKYCSRACYHRHGVRR